MTSRTRPRARSIGMNDTSWTTYESPLGNLTLVGNALALSGLLFPGAQRLDEAGRNPKVFSHVTAQLDEYFAGQRRKFDLELELQGTPFQLAVWEQLQAIPYGTTVTYSELARRIDRLDRVRAVGGAVGRTPIPIIVPCHRVIGVDGSLTGYGGGIPRKRALLEHEGAAFGNRRSEGSPRPGQLVLAP
jgi:methylated-DNA-[protein]-cysteine S-methyltransferase